MLLDAHTHPPWRCDPIRFRHHSLQEGIASRGCSATATRMRFSFPTTPADRSEVYPTGTGNITLDPSVGVTAVNLLLVVMLFLPKCT